MPRAKQYYTTAQKQAAYRNRKQAQNLLRYGLKGQLILELFPGAGLFGKAFESLGATVVRGQDILWGGDVRDFKGIAGKFDGIIGGPPCQTFSRAAITGSVAINLIPEFVRIIDECKPNWAVMENVREAKEAAPDWNHVFLRDYDCGGLTHRRRGFWFYGLQAPTKPLRREGNAEYSVLASNWNKRGTTKIHGHLYLSPSEAAHLQGYPQLAAHIIKNQPGWHGQNGYLGMSKRSREIIATHTLGNGVPKALGLYVASWVAFASNRKQELFKPQLAVQKILSEYKNTVKKVRKALENV